MNSSTSEFIYEFIVVKVPDDLSLHIPGYASLDISVKLIPSYPGIRKLVLGYPGISQLAQPVVFPDAVSPGGAASTS